MEQYTFILSYVYLMFSETRIKYLSILISIPNTGKIDKLNEMVDLEWMRKRLDMKNLAFEHERNCI